MKAIVYTRYGPPDVLHLSEVEKHAPKWIGVMLILASIVYTADSLAKFLMPNYAEYATFFLIFLLIFGIIGELSICFWLLFKGGKVK